MIPNLNFSDELKRDEISKKAKESGQAAVEMLLEAVKSAEEVGKWQAFIEALERTGTFFISNFHFKSDSIIYRPISEKNNNKRRK